MLDLSESRQLLATPVLWQHRDLVAAVALFEVAMVAQTRRAQVMRDWPPLDLVTAARIHRAPAMPGQPQLDLATEAQRHRAPAMPEQSQLD
ncbi:MAG: hypothetical protein ABI120_08475, partial [Gemmatimonadaceae bacterium]